MAEFDTVTRTYSYVWPRPSGDVGIAELTGLEQMSAVLAGELPSPPMADTMGVQLVEFEEGRVVFEMRAEEFQYNPAGILHGGAIAVLLDQAAGVSIFTTLKPGEGNTSIDLNIKFLRPATAASGILRGEGKVVQRGRRTALAESKVYDESGKLLAQATSTCMILS